jgi:hypothetical protein
MYEYIWTDQNSREFVTFHLVYNNMSDPGIIDFYSHLNTRYKLIKEQYNNAVTINQMYIRVGPDVSVYHGRYDYETVNSFLNGYKKELLERSLKMVIDNFLISNGIKCNWNFNYSWGP